MYLCDRHFIRHIFYMYLRRDGSGGLAFEECAKVPNNVNASFLSYIRGFLMDWRYQKGKYSAMRNN